jgi:cephalosporin hydroxylase
MITTVDEERGEVIVQDGSRQTRFSLASPEGFAAVSRAWLRAGWEVKYVYSFTWLGRPIIQLPEDMFRIQALIYRLKPDVIIETGVAHGGGLVFYAGLCKAMSRGRVIGVDVEIRAHNRAAIQAHELYDLITLIEGDSTDPAIVSKVKSGIRSEDHVLVLLDSNHSKKHVLAELDAYAPLINVGSYIVAMDGIMSGLVGASRSGADWAENNPRQAVREWVEANPAFVLEEPPFGFNEGLVRERVTYWPEAFLRRLR